MPRIPLMCYEFLPREPITEVVNPPLGMVHINYYEEQRYENYLNEERRYDIYLNDIVDKHIESFIQNWCNEEDQEFQKKLFCLLIQVKPKTDDEAKLLKEAVRLVVSTYIMSSSFFWVRDSSEIRSFAPPITPFEFPHAHFAARQAKYFFARLQRCILGTVLNKLQRIFLSSKGYNYWLAAFVAILCLAMANEEEQKATYIQTSKVETEILNVETFSFSEDPARAANVACRDIDERMELIFQIFRWKYNKRWNPLKDSDRDWAGEFGFGDENSQIIRKISQLVNENVAFLRLKQEVTVEKANVTHLTSHLVARFLLSFWLPQ
ncbi:hypothetical protein DM02DRAFT_271714 [Periconia macrospinosa]|uniref:Uncharacterized protein n=1 Tax=Periconia macrospinosa TaxID=97972 RepID=A0A2V1DXA9_9PLEO|nr:hypothetical protein DM02DRAFT_271714 [Periconia macrospinosa]